MPTLTPNFIRRQDLPVELRMRIASIALFFSVHGTISRLSDKYNISRQFIYNLCRDFKLYGAAALTTGCVLTQEAERQQSVSWILSLRLEGKSSIEGISAILKRFDIPNNSVGFISQELQRVGSSQPNILFSPNEGIRVVLCSDEIFSKGQVILMTVDPLSLSILHIELSEHRKGEAWEAHWTRVLEAGYVPISLCNDEGTGMSSAKKNVLSDVERQSDTFHAVAHRLGSWVERLEKGAYGCIEAEYECQRLLECAKTAEVFDKRFERYESAQKKAQSAIALFDGFTFLYACLLACFNSFDATGKLKNSEMVRSDFDTALDLIKLLGHQKINQSIQSIESCKKDLFHFLPVVEQTVERLRTQIPIDMLETLCLIWQTHKNAIKTKNTDSKNALKRKEKYLLAEMQNKQQMDTLSDWKDLVFGELNKIIQSSAAVECINSILRPYLNASKNQINQPFLNLFMAYHNHRRFRAGERKGKTPFELLSGQKQDLDWLEIVLNKAA